MEMKNSSEKYQQCTEGELKSQISELENQYVEYFLEGSKAELKRIYLQIKWLKAELHLKENTLTIAL